LRVGVLGGAFNPPHIGHMVLAQEALVQLDLERVLLMPMGDAPHREIAGDPGRDTRFELCEAAVRGDERMEVSRLEVDRDGPSYTVETLEALRSERPDDELFWILGGDQAAKLRSWREPDRVLELATIAATERGAWRRPGIFVEASHLRNSGRLVFFEMPPVGVSSTMIRRRVARGQPVKYLVPDAVAELIEERGLYAAAAGAVASSS
jgi:nicotinate-nucleotide adenylyltransferase